MQGLFQFLSKRPKTPLPKIQSSPCFWGIRVIGFGVIGFGVIGFRGIWVIGFKVIWVVGLLGLWF
jgi:hypothetical protein